MSNDVSLPTKGLSWSQIIKLLGMALPFLLTAAMLYLGKEFATHTEVSAAVAPYAPLPSQIQSLQEFKLRQERREETADRKFEAIQQDTAALKANQLSTEKKIDRVLDLLERQHK